MLKVNLWKASEFSLVASVLFSERFNLSSNQLFALSQTQKFLREFGELKSINFFPVPILLLRLPL
jgi:hypothetical protein